MIPRDTFLLTDRMRPGQLYTERRRVRGFARTDQDDRFTFGARELWYVDIVDAHGPLAAFAIARDGGR